jgi:hypothetical protein
MQPISFQWQKNSTNLIDGGNISGTATNTLIITGISDSDAANYSVAVSNNYGSVTSLNATLTVNDSPSIATQPQSQTVVVGSNVIFSAAAYGAPPLLFQWYFGNTPVGSPTSGTNVSSYTLTNVETNQAGNYTVQVVNGYNSVTSSNATLIVIAPPAITAQPTNRAYNATSNAIFSVVASSVSPMSYQWQKNGTNLVNGGKFSGVHTNTLTITTVSSNEAAIYSVIITNLAGSVTSSNATLTVIEPPVITGQPLSQQPILGSSISFTVGLNSTAPFNYRWRLNGANILNATNAAYAIASVTTNDNGGYSVVVTNAAGSVTSSNAVLKVIVPPTLVLQISAGYPLLKLSGMLSSNFTVQFTTNLPTSNWLSLLSLTNLSVVPYQFLDASGTSNRARYYRAFMQ